MIVSSGSPETEGVVAVPSSLVVNRLPISIRILVQTITSGLRQPFWQIDACNDQISAQVNND